MEVPWEIVLIEEILHQVVYRLSHYLQGFINILSVGQDFWTINSSWIFFRDP